MIASTIRFFLLLWLTVTVAVCAAPSERADLLPVHAFWQWYPPDVRSVTIDRQGRPWFMLEGFVPKNELKRQVESAVHLQAPYVTGRIVLFDSGGRVWLCTAGSDNSILGFDTRAGKWIERAGMLDPGQSYPTFGHMLTDAAVEDRQGRIFIADMSGCHVLDDRGWSYQSFFAEAGRRGGQPPVLTVDEQGRVFAWTPAGEGFWLHDEKGWRLIAAASGPQGASLSAVIPLRHNRVFVCPRGGIGVVMRTDVGEESELAQLKHDVELLADPDHDVRQAAQQRIIERGPTVNGVLKKELTKAQSPEQGMRLRQILSILENPAVSPGVDGYLLQDVYCIGRDLQGNSYVSCKQATSPDRHSSRRSYWVISAEGQVDRAPVAVDQWTPASMLSDSHGRLFLQHYVHGLAVIEQAKFRRLTDDLDAVNNGLLGEDQAGRVYVRTMSGIVAVDPAAPDLRRTLPVASFPTTGWSACQDSRGRIVAKLQRPDHPFLSVFEKGTWQRFGPEVRGLQDFISLRALRNGAILAPQKWSEQVFFFDGTAWSGYASLRDLVQERREQLLSVLTDGRGERLGERGIVLRADAHKNIWCVQFDHADVFDGTQWLSWPGFQPKEQFFCCVPVFGQELMLLSAGNKTALARLREHQVRTIDYGALTVQLQTFQASLDLQADRRGRVLLRRTIDSAFLLDGEHLSMLEKTGIPRFEDSSGRLWFVNPDRRALVILDSSQRRVEWTDLAINQETTVVENRPGSYWVNTARGLRHLVDPAGGGAPEPEGTYYEKGVPKGQCAGLWIDPDGRLWFAGAGNLHEIELPRNR